MKTIFTYFTMLILTSPALAQESRPAAVPKSSDLVADGAKVTQLAEGFVFTEGPACDAEGNVFFSDVRDSKTYKWSVDGKLSTFRENTLETNGMYFDNHGNLVCCEVVGRKVSRVDMHGNVTTIVDNYDGKKFNSPNDVWVDPTGGFYFTDPRYRVMEGLEQDGFHVYYVAAGGTEAIRVIDNLVKPNGIVGTSDGKTLYVADHGDNKTYAYEITSPGQLGQRRLLTAHGSDGMTLDERGNVYLTNEEVDVFDASGQKLTTIEVPGNVTNVVFGGKDRKTLFITANNRLYSVKMNVRGM